MFAIETLPVEILLLISEFLSPEDVVCFCLANTRIFVALARRRKHLTPPQGRDKLPILYRLERDFPAYFACQSCFILHKFKRNCIGSPAPYYAWVCRLPCVKCFPQPPDGLGLKIHRMDTSDDYQLLFVHIQLVMRHFRYGPRFGLNAKELSYTRVKEWDNGTTLLSVEAQICTVNSKSASSSTPVPRQEAAKYSGRPTDFEAANLCLRIQDIMMMTGTAVDFLPPPERAFTICGHISQTRLSHLIFSHILSSTAGARETPFFPSYSNNCKQCNTDYQLELHFLGQNDLALVITRWLNLGAGLTPEDPQWRVHGYSWPPKCMTAEYYATVTSPRMLFEASLPKRSSVETLCSYNLSLLKGRNYRIMMNQDWWPRDIWEYRGDHTKRRTGYEAFDKYLKEPCLKKTLRQPKEQEEMELWRQKDELRLSRQREEDIRYFQR